MRANSHDYYERFYFDDYEYVNQNINLVFNLPIRYETKIESVKELFNKIYYDYRGYIIYPHDRGYGFQSFILSKDGYKHIGYYGFTNPTVRLSRNADGNIEIYWIPGWAYQ